jgi:hypothetical protein
MKHRKMVRFINFIAFFIFVGTVQAQEIVMITQPAANKVGLQDAFEVRYIIRNASQVEGFTLPESKDLIRLSGPTQSQNISINNGERSVSYELTYVMRAKHTGKVVVPGGIATSRGREYRSNNVSIEVIEGSVRTQPNRQQRGNSYDPFDDPFFNQDPFAGGNDIFAALQKQHQQMMDMLRRQQQNSGQGNQARPAPRSFTPQSQRPEIVSKADIPKNIFIKVDVNKTKVKLGEQITASYKLYSRLPMEVNLTKLPSLIGFWSQDFKLPPEPKPSRELVDGKEYQVFEIKRSALFPTQTGNLTLDPAQAEGRVQLLKPHQQEEKDPFDSFFGGNIVTNYAYENEQVVLKSEPVNIQVLPIPLENRPKSYQGAVGDFTIESNIDKTELSTDDNASITLRVSGTGNLKLIGTPVINWPKDIDPFDPVVNDTITNTSNIIAGYKTFTYAFSPRVAGTFTIPSTEFTFYETESGSYKTLKTPAYTLHVTPGKIEGKTVGGKLPKDIHDIDAKPQALRKVQSQPLVANPIYWTGFGIPLLAYFGVAFFKRKEDELKSNQTLYKNKRANKVALKRLALAETFLQQSSQNDFYEETSKAVWLYLSDKLAIPLALLSKELAGQKMQEKNVSKHLQNELFRITDECEMALYAPEQGSMRMHQTYSDTLRLIGKLEEEIA